MVLTTGGTILSRKGKEGLVPVCSPEEILRIVPTLRVICDIEIESIMSISSPNIQPDDWITIAKQIMKAVEEYDGIVLVHGTDTMAYTSSALSFLIQGVQKPVVITGSQIPLHEVGTDAIKNMNDACIVACENISGVFVVFNGKIIKGCRVSKIGSGRLDAFASINYPYIGMIFDKKVKYLHTPTPTSRTTDRNHVAICPRVILVKLVPGTSPSIFDFLVDLRYKGMVIESFGKGGLPNLKNSLVQKVEELTRRGISVAVTTQCLFDGCDLTLYENGQQTLKSGAIPTGDMTTESTVTKLMWALGKYEDPLEVRRVMLTNYVDEISE
jgi:L-asparaginase